MQHDHKEWRARQRESLAAQAPAAPGRTPAGTQHMTDEQWEAMNATAAQRPPAGYEQLHRALMDALAQASHGKGRERHAKGQPFHEQRMQSISHLIGTGRGMAFQVIKKLTEGMDLPDPGARERELLGAINYLAGMVVYFRNQEERNAAGD